MLSQVKIGFLTHCENKVLLLDWDARKKLKMMIQNDSSDLDEVGFRVQVGS